MKVSGKEFGSRVANIPGPVFLNGDATVTQKLVLWWLIYQVSDGVHSDLGLVGPAEASVTE